MKNLCKAAYLFVCIVFFFWINDHYTYVEEILQTKHQVFKTTIITNVETLMFASLT